MKSHLFILLLLFLSTISAFSQTKPSLENTGTNGTLTTYNGSTTIVEDGTVLKDLIINGSLNIRANNVIVKNCKITTDGFYGIRANFGYTSLLIEDCEISGMKSAAIFGNNFVARRCKIWDSGADGIKPGENFLIEGCYFYNLGYIEDAHADGIQMVAGGNGIIRGNTFDMPFDAPGYKNSQCIIILTNNAPIDDVKIENNWIDGGGYSVQVRDKENGNGIPTNVSITNNLFGRNHQFGTHTIDDGVIWSCNKWEDTNQLIGECNINLSINDELLQEKIAAYPNPASDQLTITVQKIDECMISIYNLEGGKVYQSLLNSKSTAISTENWSDGIYFIEYKTENTHTRSKLIIQN